jgi:hypothetical protein
MKNLKIVSIGVGGIAFGDAMKRAPGMLLALIGTGVILIVLAVGVDAADPGLTHQDRQGPVTVTATLLPSVAASGPLRVKIALNTHSVNLDGVAFEHIVALRGPDGRDVAPVAVEQAKGGGHHREAVVVFAAGADVARPRIVVKDVGGVGERLFTFERRP